MHVFKTKVPTVSARLPANFASSESPAGYVDMMFLARLDFSRVVSWAAQSVIPTGSFGQERTGADTVQLIWQ